MITKNNRVRPIEPLTCGEVVRLLNQISIKSSTGQRNRALIVSWYRAGLRLQESLDLLPRDLDLERFTIRVQRGKRGKYRLAAIDEQSCVAIARWMARRTKLGHTDDKPFFCTITSAKPLSQAYCREFLTRAKKQAGITKRVHPHGMRHTHAMELADEGVPLNVIQSQLGHSSLATTSVYLEHLSPHALTQAIAPRRWQTAE